MIPQSNSVMIRDDREWYLQDQEGQIHAFREIYKTPRVNTWHRNKNLDVSFAVSL